ncbi:site-2 protease family protein [Patescibacteria group bacterium]|nr:MAG: site-2 protease family protein [Patescibacteria group bacterium]
MLFTLLAAAPAIALAWVAAILAALTVHEFSHALMAKFRGDRTAEWEGRLTLNPLSHIDPIGFLSLLLVGFGWAKPVPYNPNNLKDAKWDQVAVALMGPVSNLILATVAALVLRLLVWSGIVSSLNLLVIFLFLLVFINLGLAFFNFIPVHPLDGSKMFFVLFNHPKHFELRRIVGTYGSQILMALVVLSLVTPFNPFFFVDIPTQAACDFLLSEDCRGFFGAMLSAVSR